METAKVWRVFFRCFSSSVCVFVANLIWLYGCWCVSMYMLLTLLFVSVTLPKINIRFFTQWVSFSVIKVRKGSATWAVIQSYRLQNKMKRVNQWALGAGGQFWLFLSWQIVGTVASNGPKYTCFAVIPQIWFWNTCDKGMWWRQHVLNANNQHLKWHLTTSVVVRTT